MIKQKTKNNSIFETIEKKTDMSIVGEKRNEEKVLFTGLEGKMLFVKVGNADYPASDGDIGEIENKLNGLMNDLGIKCLVFVTHHLVEVEIIK